MKFASNAETGRVTPARWLRLNLLLLALVLFTSLSFPAATLSQKLNDFFFRLRPPQPTSSQVALVLIDDATLTQFGRWPWPRQRLAQLVRAVAAQQPRAVGLDILLAEPEDEANDAAIESAIRSAPNVVLAAKISSGPGNHSWTDPLPRFARVAAGIGHVQAIVDPDGLCRSIPAEEPSIDGSRPAFAVKLAELAQSPSSEHVSARQSGPGIEQISLRPLLIDFRRQFQPGRTEEQPPFVAISAGDLLAGKSAPGLKGKAALIGFGSVEMSDRLATPVSAQLPMPGVEINANALDMLISGRVIEYISEFNQVLLVVLVSAFSLWLVVRYPGTRGLLILGGVTLAAGVGSYQLFVHFHRLLSLAPVLLAGVLAAPLAQLENLLLVDREVSARLRQLREIMRPGATGSSSKLASSTRLHWKLAALNELQTELSSLYSFQNTLLETMREGVAVYAEGGALRFGNSSWKKFCERQGAAPDNLSALTQVVSSWPELPAVAQSGGTWVENEVPLGDELWHFYAVPLPWTSFAESGALMLIAEDITVRRQRDQARSEALSFVTHELRTPLIAIQGFSEMLMRYPNSPAGAEAPGTIFRESNRLVAMINTYLEVLRLDAGARPLRLKKASISGMAGHVEKVVRPLAAAAKIEVKTEIDCDDDLVLCDETLIAGALLNLVSNAIKYGTAGSEVRVRVTSRNNEYAFEVHNSGPAIPAADLEQIFERFYRPSRSETIPGWGLGLSFVRRICQQHGGSVQVSSNEISGTSFRFMLPRGAHEVTEVTP
ncbi:MAG TPA: CHASE2 domain-containing protein [Candidatus Angelobacter sp.]